MSSARKMPAGEKPEQGRGKCREGHVTQGRDDTGWKSQGSAVKAM